MNSNPAWVRDVLTFWFSELTPKDWFRKNDVRDAEIRDRFLVQWENWRNSSPDDFLGDADTALAAVILFDQFSRNMFRDDPRAFACDTLARTIASAAIDQGFDLELDEDRRQFYYMPFMHSENMADQDRSIELFRTFSGEGSLGFAIAHRKVIAKFGRFPHRNAALGRDTTAEEEDAMEKGAVW